MSADQITMVEKEPMKIIGLKIELLDPESEVMMNYYKLVGYAVDLVGGATKASFAGYHTKGAMLRGKGAINSVNSTLQMLPPSEGDTQSWILTTVLFNSNNPNGNPDNIFNGVQPVFEEFSNV